jgi:O-antigen ligase
MWRNVKTGRGATIFLAFLFVLLPIIMVPSAIDPDLNPRIIAVSLFCLICLIFFGRQIVLLPESFRNVGITSLALLMIAIFSTISAVNSGEAFAEWLRICIIYLFLLVSVTFLQKYDLNFHTVVRFISLAVLIFCSFAILQTVPIIEAILANKKFSISSSLASTLSNKNFFSEVLVLFTPAVFYGIINDEKRFRSIHIPAFILAVFYIILLTSVACWVAFFVSIAIVCFVFLMNRNADTLVVKKSTAIALTAITFILLAIGYLVFEKVPVAKGLKFKAEMVTKYISDPALLQQNASSNNNSVFDRLLMIKNSLLMISDHPVSGVGMNNWKLFYTSYGIGGTEVINSGAMNFEHPHNDYLLIFSEQGVFGLLAYLLFFYFVLKAWRTKWKNATSSDRTFLLVILFAIISFLILSLFSYPRSRIYSSVLLMFYISLIFIKQDSENAELKKPESKFVLKPVFIYSFAIICLASLIVTSIRLDSEIHAKKMIKAKFQSNFARVIRESEKINEYFYPLEFSSTSIDWYKGMALFYSGQIPAALASYQKAILKTPYHLRTLNDLATAYEQTGLPDSAISLYKRALAISPNLHDSRFNLSATYFNQNKVDSAYNILNYITYKNLNIGPQENYVKFMSVILAARIQDSLKISTDTVMISKMNSFISDLPRTKKYIRAYEGRSIWPDVFKEAK